jgi:hypothetical protein
MTHLNITQFQVSPIKYKYFHSSQIIFSDEDTDLQRRVDNLKDLKLDENFIITEKEADSFQQKLDRMRELEELTSLDSHRSWDEIKYNISSFEESFPKYKKEIPSSTNTITAEDTDILKDVFDLISQVSKLEHDEVTKILKENGLINGLKIISNNPKFIQEFSGEKVTSEPELSLLKQKVTDLEKSYEAIKEELNSVKEGVTDINDLTHKIDTSLDASKKAFEFFIANQSNLNLIVGATAVISPFLAYRGLLSTYMKVAIPVLPTNASPEVVKFNQLLRQRTIRKFNVIAIPMICTYYLYLNHYHKVFITKFNLIDNGQISTSSIGLLSKTPKWITFVIMPIITLSLSWILPLITKKYFPSIYTYFQEIISHGTYWLTYPLLFWLIGWILYFILELYLYIIFATQDKHRIIRPKYLPKFVLNWLETIETESKHTTKHWVINFYLRTIFFYIIITLLFIYLFII